MKKFLFVLPWDLRHPGGVNQVVGNLMDTVKKEHPMIPLLLINSWDNFFLTKKAFDNQTFFKFRMRSLYAKERPLFNCLKFFLFIFYDLCVLTYLVKKHDIIAINIHYPGLPSLHFILLKFFGIFKGNIIISFHGSDIRDISRSTRIEKKIWQFIFNRTDAVVCCSKDLCLRVLDQFSSLKRKISIVYNGVDQDGIISSSLNDTRCGEIKKISPYILSVGAFRHLKGHDVLLKAFKLLLVSNPEVYLVIIGSKHSHFDVTKTYIQKNNLDGKVILITDLPHRKIAIYYKKACLFVLPSRMEAFGIVLLEAGLFKLPVIASNVGGIPEVIIDNKTGMLFQSEDHVALSEKMQIVINDPEKALKLGENLHTRIQKRFTWKIATKKYLSIMKNKNPLWYGSGIKG